MTAAATIRKALGGSLVAAATTAYGVLNANGFDVGHVTGSQWESVAIAGLAAFTAVYHLPNAASVKVREVEAAAEVVQPGIIGELHTQADPSLDALLSWAEGLGEPPAPEADLVPDAA